MIRTFKKADSERCSEIMRACIEMMEEYEPKLNRLIYASWTAQMIAKKACEFERLLVYEQDAEVLGLGAFDEGRIEVMYVDPLHHHEGIGGTLLNALERYAKTKGLKKLEARSSFLAEDFYREHGYETIDKGFSELGEFVVVWIKMEKTLGG